MRVLFCKIHCPPFICSCKPSSHIYTSDPTKFENTPQREASSELSTDAIDAEQEEREGERKLAENHLKSSLRKPKLDQIGSIEDGKKRVQWIDFLGKDLAQIKEFESSESGENENEGEEKRVCGCTIF